MRGKREWNRRIFGEIMAETFPKPTEDSGRVTNHKIHLCKISDDQRQKENPLKSSQRYKFNKTKLYF